MVPTPKSIAEDAEHAEPFTRNEASNVRAACRFSVLRVGSDRLQREKS